MDDAIPSTAHLSIEDTARLFPRERLIEDPRLWTPRHLQLLPCRFEDPEIIRPEDTAENDMEQIQIEIQRNNFTGPPVSPFSNKLIKTQVKGRPRSN